MAWLEMEPREEMYVNYNPAEELLRANSIEYQSINIGARSKEEEDIKVIPQFVKPTIQLEPETMSAMSGLSGFIIMDIGITILIWAAGSPGIPSGKLTGLICMGL